MPYGEARTEPMRRVAVRGGKNQTEAAGMPRGEAIKP